MKNLEKLTNIIEALLFVSGKEILIDEIAEKLGFIQEGIERKI